MKDWDNASDTFLEDYCIFKNIKLTGILLLPQFIEQNIPIGKWIINNDSINRGGTHWVSCIVWLNKEKNYEKTLFWGDSFGYTPHDILKNKCKQLGIPIYYSNIEFQAINEQNCGIWACGFLAFIQDEPKLNIKFINTALKELKNYKIQ